MTSHLSPDDRAELNRIWSELAAAQRVIERLLGDDDPTGLRYSRDDDEPPAASTRPHDGYSLTGRDQRPTNSPAGFASTERRARRSDRPGAQLPEVSLGRATSGMRAALPGGRAALALRGGAR